MRLELGQSTGHLIHDSYRCNMDDIGTILQTTKVNRYLILLSTGIFPRL